MRFTSSDLMANNNNSSNNNKKATTAKKERQSVRHALAQTHQLLLTF